MNAAVDELRSGRSRMMLAGGVNASLPAEVTVIFTQLGALSGRGKVRPFATGSDGTLLGEGLGVVVLKRLADALADGDRVYAVLRGVGQASDGRGHGLLAPSVEGETLAIRRAYDSTGVDPATIGLVEAHGTGIPLGDKTEIAALKNVFGERRTGQGAIAIGSVKSMISHCIPAAGIAGLIKTALALHHRTLPPTLCDAVNPELGIAATPFYVNTEAGPWIERLGSVRRAGVNSFGFGGINAHAIVEEAPPEAKRPERCTPWPAELVVLSAATPEALLAKLERARRRRSAQHRGDAAGRHRRGAGARRPRRAGPAGPRGQGREVARQAASSRRCTGCATSRRRAGRCAAARSTPARPMPASSRSCSRAKARSTPGMLGRPRHVLRRSAAVARLLAHALRPAARRQPHRHRLSACQRDGRREHARTLDARLHDMDVGSEAVFVAGMAMHALLRSLGVEPDVMLGHSSGESAALAASGALPAETPLELAAFVRELNAVYERVLAEGKIPDRRACSRSARCRPRRCRRRSPPTGSPSRRRDGQLRQPAGAVRRQGRDRDAAGPCLPCAGAICMPLPFDRGYHTADFAGVSAAFLAYYGRIKLRAPRVPLYSCASAQLFPDDGRRRAQARRGAVVAGRCAFARRSSRWSPTACGCFVEVGPSGNLTAFVNDIPAGKAQVRDREQPAPPQRRRAIADGSRPALRERAAGAPAIAVRRPAHRRRRPGEACRLASLRCAARQHHADDSLFGARPGGLAEVLATPCERRARRSCSRGRSRPQRLDVAREPEIGAPYVDSRSASSSAIRAPSVMAEYFDVMRGFLEQQRAVVESWQARRSERPSPGRRPRVADLPFLERDRRARRAPPGGALPSEPAPTTSCAATCSRAGYPRAIRSCRAWRACR